jgi:hypothetical protein
MHLKSQKLKLGTNPKQINKFMEILNSSQFQIQISFYQNLN